MEERHDVAGDRIDSGQVGAFAQIATMTGKSKIAGIVAPAMLIKRAAVLRNQTIFATVSGSGPDECPRPQVHR
jgi:hypothetical protein